MTAYGDRFHDAEAPHRTGREPPGLELVGGEQRGGGGVDDDAVAARHRGQPGGHVDRRPEHVAEPHDDRPAGQAEPDVGHPGVAADHVDDPLGDVEGTDRVVAHEQDRVADALDHPAPLGGDHVGAAGLEELDEVADAVLADLVRQRREADDVGEADRQVGGVQVLLVGAERLDAGDRGGEVAAPRVDQQALEGVAEPLQQAERRADPAAGGVLTRLELLDPLHQRGDLPVGQPGHGLPDRPGEVDRHVEVDQPLGHHPDQGGDGLGVGPGERGLDAVLGEAERTPQPARLLDRHTGLGRDLEGVEDRLLAQDRVLELVPGCCRVRFRHGVRSGRWGRAAAG